MNKKQEMVSELTARIEKSRVVLDEDTVLRASADFWTQYPDGHYCSMDEPTVEEQLSCFSISTLERILADDKLVEGMQFHEMWRAWGKARYFICEPELMNESIPILRIRHDSYLSWFRGYRFQNSYDAHANGSNGASTDSLRTAIAAITIPEYSSLWDDNDEAGAAWNKEWALFRKAMILAYPFEACAGKASFYNALSQHSDVFEEFMNLTDSKVMHLNLDVSLTLSKIRKQCSAYTPSYPVAAELAVIHNDSLYAVLRYSEESVSLTWSQGNKSQRLTVPFPKWDETSYRDELCGIDVNAESPRYLSQRSYLNCVWDNLSIVLLTVAGFDASSYRIEPRNKKDFDKAGSGMFPEDMCVIGLRDIQHRLYEASKSYPDKDEMIKRCFN